MINLRPLRPYQEQCVDHLQAHDGAALFVDMGGGKTASVLRALRPSDLPALILAPKRVAESVWPVETPVWGGWLDIRVARGYQTAAMRRLLATDAERRMQILRSDADLIVVGRENIADAVAVAKAGVRSPLHRKRPWKRLIIDELSTYGSRGSWFMDARRLRKLVSGRVWGLTGTPRPHSYLGLWGQVGLLDGGTRLGTTFEGYRDRFFIPDQYGPGGRVVSWKLRNDYAKEQIQELIADICISIDEGLLGTEKVPIDFNYIKAPLPAAALRAYEDIRQEMVTEVDGEWFTAANSAVAAGKLGQVAAGFLYEDAPNPGKKYKLIHHEKIKAAREVVDGTSTPLLMWYRFQHERDELMKAIPEAVRPKGSEWIGAWNRSEIPVLLAHPAEIGHGLNLQYGDGHTACWVSRDWPLELWDQGNKRLARPGQKRPVRVHVIQASNGITELPCEEAVDMRLRHHGSEQLALRRALEPV